jgi:Rod binding domain-containing protein
MKLAPLTALASIKPEAADAADKRKLAEATRSFEGVLIRQMLTSLEKTTQMSGSKSLGSQSAYSSMMVDALSDAIARSGGLGLADSLGATLSSQLDSQTHPEAVPLSPVKPLK